MSYENVKGWRHRTKDRMLNAFDNKCGICGYNKSSRALSFHHMGEEKKDFGLSSIMKSAKSWNKIADELKKCILVCANCHMEIHDNITSIPDSIQRFIEPTIESKEDICPVCGGPKSIKQFTCSLSCAGKRQRKCDWDNIDLISLYEEMGSYNKVAIFLGVSHGVIKKHLNEEYGRVAQR